MPVTGPNNASVTLEQILPAAARARILRWAPYLLFLGLLVLCGYLAARLSWQFAAPAPASAAVGGDKTVHSAGPEVAQTPANKIVAAHLFGIANAPAESVAARNAPETSLDLGLAGVAAANPGTRSFAIIKTNGKTENTYAVGAKLPDGALIRDILPDRIVIAHNGRLETLRLPISTPAGAGGAGEKPEPNTSTRLASSTPAQNGFSRPGGGSGWKAIPSPEGPKGLGQYIRLDPYSPHGGHIQGYKVYPGEHPELFQKSGLKPGDVVTSINGIPLDSPAGIKKATMQLRKAKGPVHLVVLRNNHKLNVIVNFGG